MARQKTQQSVSLVYLRPSSLAVADLGAEDKQKKLLQSDSGHFSMIKMLHLADLITELNGTSPPLRS